MDALIRRWLSDPTVEKALTAVVAVAVVLTIGGLVKSWVRRHVKDNASRYRVRKVVTFSAYGAAALILVAIFSEKLVGFTVALGVAGAGVAFALQEVIASVAGWVAISFGNVYATGDRVELKGIKGDVIDIGVLRTTLMEIGEWVKGDLYSGRIVRVANSVVFKEPVLNYSADFPFLWDEITLPVRYGSDWKLAREMLARVADEVCKDYALQSKEAWNEAVAKYRLEPAQVEPMVTLVANDNWLEFTLRYIVDYRKRRSVKDRLFTRILEEVDKSGDRIRLASATFELVNIPKLDVAFSNGQGSVSSSFVP